MSTVYRFLLLLLGVLFSFALGDAGGLVPLARGDVIINEFLAENDGGLTDEDGETPDWIELRNTGGAALNLAGWRLTDTPTNFAKWVFPAVDIPANGYLVVFASGKDRATNGAPLHTNFRLENGGGYLGLINPGGIVVTGFEYPNQRRNVGFGPGSGIAPAVNLLGAGASARWWVPGDAGLGAAWIAPSFDDGGWSNGATPLRYSAGAAPGAPLLSVDFNDDDSGESGVANSETGFNSMTLSGNPANFGGVGVALTAFGGGVLDDRDRATPVQGGALTLDQVYDDFIFVLGTTNGNGGRIQISGLAPLTDYRLTVWSFDSSSTGSRLSDWVEVASGLTRVITNGYAFDGAVLPIRDTDSSFGGLVQSSVAGALTIEGRRNGGTSHGVFLNALELAPMSGFSVAGDLAAMYGSNSSVYARIAFPVNDVSGFASLTLRVRYDDGFVAYLNGTEIARRNAPVAPMWNSAATAAHSDLVAEDILLPGALSLLVPGQNVLAVHGLNLASTNAGFLFEPELYASLTAPTNGYFSPATPGGANGPALFGVVADTKFSVNRGFYDGPFSLSITTATAGAVVRYTTNGSAPSATNGIVLSVPLTIDRQSFVRAAAFKAGWVPSDIDTHSYIFLRDVAGQSNGLPGYPTLWQASYPADYGMDSGIVNHAAYGPALSNAMRSIPSLMVVSDQGGLWSASTGIYPNSTSSGPGWERAASLELIGGDGGTEFAVTTRLEMHGNASRDNVRTPKHSMHVVFNGDYGPTKLRYDWFGGGVETHNKIIFRSCGFVDGWAGRYADNSLYTSGETGESFRGLRYRPENTCYLRDVWVKDSFRDMGWLSSRSEFVHLYLNGLYWGLYQPSEAPTASYFAEHVGGPEGAWDVLVGEDNNGPPVVVDGSGVGWTNVLNLANAGINSEAAYAAITNLVEIDNLIDYMLVHIFAESEDWPRHNWYLARRRATNGIPGTKFLFTVWDQELTLDRLVRRNRINVGNGADGAGELYSPARVYAQLRNWPEFRRQFGDRVHKHLFNGGALVPASNVARLLSPANRIRDALVGESARWGDARKTGVPAGQLGTGQTFTRDEWWQPEIDKMATNFFQKLTADNVARMRAGLLYPTVGAPEFSQFGGAVPAGFPLSLAHTNAGGVIYFTTDGTDPRTYGSGGVAAGASGYSEPIGFNAPTLVRARVLLGGAWSALCEAMFYPPQDLSQLALTELMYNPPPDGGTDGDEYEFIELKNSGTNVLNLSGLKFSGVDFTFPNGTTVAPGAFVVLVRNPVAFAAKYPGVAMHGLYAGRLANGGEQLRLTHALGQTIFAVTFGDGAPWPAAADGHGFSIVPMNPGVSQAPDDGRAWRASANPGGSPGADDPASGVPRIVINEVLTASEFPQVDRIELYNPTGAQVDVGGWLLTDDAGVPRKFRIAAGTVLPAGGFVVFDETQFNATPGTNGGFSLSSRGESLYLFSADANTNLTGYSHGFAFEAADAGVSFGRHLNSAGEEQFPAQIATTFGAGNGGPRVGPMVIGEIHYHPAPGGDEFIELANITAVPVALFDLVAPGNVWRVEGIDYAFPTNLVIPGGGLVLLVATNPAVFRARYDVPAEVLILGPFSGALQDSGERLKLVRPAPVDTNGLAFVVIDSVRYNDKAPWPATADGLGLSLQRRLLGAYGDDPQNWEAAGPTPGRGIDAADYDGDALPDGWELANGTDRFVADADVDLDGDGASNLDEFLAGTDPQSAASYLKVAASIISAGTVRLEFQARAGRSYSVLFKSSLSAPGWQKLQDVSSVGFDRDVVVEDSGAAGAGRFYRIVTPAAP